MRLREERGEARHVPAGPLVQQEPRPVTPQPRRERQPRPQADAAVHRPERDPPVPPARREPEGDGGGETDATAEASGRPELTEGRGAAIEQGDVGGCGGGCGGGGDSGAA